jgi:hypothetical protein
MPSLEQNILENQFNNEGRENLDWILYDSLFTVASATQTLTFFQNTVGGVGRGRTNMKNAGMLPSPQAMLVTEIGLRFMNNNGTCFFSHGAGAGAAVQLPLDIMIATGFFDIIVEPRTEYEGHLMQFRQTSEQVLDTPAALATVQNTPMGMNLQSIKLKKPIVLGPNRAFSLRLTLTTPAAAGGYVAANTLVYFIFKGILRRNGG